MKESAACLTQADGRPTLFDIPSSNAVAWQRIIRDKFCLEQPRAQIQSLVGYSVETVGRMDAQIIIDKYEWLGNMGNSKIFIGLISPLREVHGVAAFGDGPQGTTRKLVGWPSFCLNRGACVHYAPPNAASFLISRACKLVCKITGVSVFFAYADPNAGEYGAVYQAANWIYLGQGVNGPIQRANRTYVLPPGKDPDNPANWMTTRVLRRPHNLTYATARAAGWQIADRPAKHVYAVNVGKNRKQWLSKIVSRPYPSPRPELKRHDHPRA